MPRMTLEKMLRTIVLGGVFLLPFLALYVSESLFFPFISGKNFAFRIIVEIIASAWLALAIASPAYRPRMSGILVGFAAFVAIMSIANMFGTYPHKSFWSNYERMEGWVTLAHLLMFFVVAHTTLNTERLWKSWWHVSLGVSAIVAFIGMLQLIGFVTINQGNIRLDARLGNATYLAVYMLFHVFMAALLLARAWVENGPGKRFPSTFAYGSLIVADSFILFFTSTRGAILGLIGGATLAALILIALAPRSRVAWRSGVVIAAFLVLSGAFFAVSDRAWVQNIEPLRRLADITKEGVPDAREMNWGMAYQGFQERPILGWGQEGYSAVFDKYYDPNMHAQEPWFDRVHNIFFDWLIAGGILGLLGYLSLYFFAMHMLWRSGAFAPYERAVLTGLIAGYFFYLIFTFDNITSYILFFALLAYITTRSQLKEPSLATSTPATRALLPWTALGAVVLASGTVYFVNADAITQNRAIIQGISPQQGGITQNLAHFKRAVAFHNVGDQEVREQFSQAAISVIGIQEAPVELKQDFVRSAYEAMLQLSDTAPNNARFPFFMGILLDQAGAYPDAKRALERARVLSPKKQSILFELGLNAFARNAPDEALAYFKEAYDYAPEYRDAHMHYAAALIRAGKDAEADALLKSLMEAGSAADPRIASAYAARNRYDKIVEIWSAHIAKRPKDLEAHYVLAGALYSGGNSGAAIAVLEAIKRDFPESTTQADSLIQQVKSGVK